MKTNTSRPAILGGSPACDTLLPIINPYIPDLKKLEPHFRNILDSGMLTNSSYVGKLEERIAELTGARHCVALSSCTSGMILTLHSADLPKGSEVILPSFTFFSTGHAILWNGLKPVFADVRPDTLNVDVSTVEKVMTKDTSALLVPHIFGNPAPATELHEFAKKNGLKLFFDAAHGMGSSYPDKPVGSGGDGESFSLSPTKLLVAAEGGFLTTNDTDTADFVTAGRNYGDTGDADPITYGLNARMSEFHAVLAYEGLALLDSKLERRSQVATSYREMLSEVPGLRFQKIEDGCRTTNKDFSIVLDPVVWEVARDTVYDALLAENIMVKRYFFPPLHRQNCFANYRSEDASDVLGNTNEISNNVISLPIYYNLKDEDVEKVVEAIAKLYQYRHELKEKEA
ncbi:DegT/DnrJ/EryC1/StrS family aminotransferase [Candidatus Hydrogenedentota bacterium]